MKKSENEDEWRCVKQRWIKKNDNEWRQNWKIMKKDEDVYADGRRWMNKQDKWRWKRIMTNGNFKEDTHKVSNRTICVEFLKPHWFSRWGMWKLIKTLMDCIFYVFQDTVLFGFISFVFFSGCWRASNISMIKLWCQYGMPWYSCWTDTCSSHHFMAIVLFFTCIYINTHRQIHIYIYRKHEILS